MRSFAFCDTAQLFLHQSCCSQALQLLKMVSKARRHTFDDQQQQQQQQQEQQQQQQRSRYQSVDSPRNVQSAAPTAAAVETPVAQRIRLLHEKKAGSSKQDAQQPPPLQQQQNHVERLERANSLPSTNPLSVQSPSSSNTPLSSALSTNAGAFIAHIFKYECDFMNKNTCATCHAVRCASVASHTLIQ